ncbi:hypothetical protein PR048_008354 [Dryococelus australis]|uniref:Uncharacterized protein n=1 Tax=Dryococelus australis TaxID=614101 RepID=A0ABQ9HWZ0_9NEOP|nr:hypothetical protein PR048_008354 [Dryococelus australis]
MKDFLLTLHASTGCDTVLSPYRKGKIAPFIKVHTDKHLRKMLCVFNNPQASADVVADAGKAFFISTRCMDQKIMETQAAYVYVKTIAKQPVHARFNLAILSPAYTATRDHSLRVIHQVQEWCGVKMDPLYWGWKIVNGCLRPIPSSKNAPPQDILQFVFCSCTNDCERSCECHRISLKYSTKYMYCAGHGCSNRDVEDDEDMD